MDRRTFNTALFGAAVTSVSGCAITEQLGIGKQDRVGRAVFYQCVGDQLTHWDVDVEKAELTRRNRCHTRTRITVQSRRSALS